MNKNDQAQVISKLLELDKKLKKVNRSLRHLREKQEEALEDVETLKLKMTKELLK